MNTTTQLEMTNVKVQKDHRLDNQQPSSLKRRRFNDYPFGEYAQVGGSAENFDKKLRYSLNCMETCSRVDNLGVKWYYHGQTQYKEKNMIVTIEVVERFHEKWELNKENGCWEWIAATAGAGYGEMKIPGTRKQIYAHRLSYLIHYGEIPEGMMACHTCDNPKCVKPSHLFLGSCEDNLQDMKAKDRHLRGSRNKKAKLTEEKVRHIHRLYKDGVSQGKIGKAYGVSQGQIFRIIHGMRWNKIYCEIHPDKK
jgi:hypothetical protein